MESMLIQTQQPFQFMTSKFCPLLSTAVVATSFKRFSASSSSVISTNTPELLIDQNPEPTTRNGKAAKVVSRGSKGILEAQLKMDWLDSLSCPFPHTKPLSSSGWVIGVDPDTSGALALLKPDQDAEVFDSPHVKVLVGKGVRKRLDAKSIVQLLQSFEAPIGTTAYIEQSTPYPQDGKQTTYICICGSGLYIPIASELHRIESVNHPIWRSSFREIIVPRLVDIVEGWWSGGFGYGIWIGVLVASGFSVIPVPSSAWKSEFQLTRERSNKDYSREAACALFPSLSSLLKRKKDHGRAEALLIAAYGKGLKISSDSFCTVEN